MRYFWLLFVINLVVADSFSESGCYKQSLISSLLSYDNEDTYQSTSLCKSACSGKRVMALLEGKYCYCGDLDPDEDDQVSDLNCDTPCQGYDLENCGGDGYFEVFINSDVDNEEAATLTSSSSAKSSSAKTSSKSSTKTTSSTSSSSTETSSLIIITLSSTEAETSSEVQLSEAPLSLAEETSSSSSKLKSSTKAQITTLVSTVTLGPSNTQSVIEITKTASATAATSSALESSQAPSSGSRKSLSTGGIVGVVIGALAGIGLLVAGALFFLWYRRRKSDDDDHDDEFTLSGPAEKTDYSISTNPFIANGTDATAAGAMAAAGMAISQNASRSASHHHKNSSYGNNSYNNNSYSSTNEDNFHFDDARNLPNDFAKPEDFGRRRLSDGSLPDMVARNPGSLKVVNN